MRWLENSSHAYNCQFVILIGLGNFWKRVFHIFDFTKQGGQLFFEFLIEPNVVFFFKNSVGKG